MSYNTIDDIKQANKARGDCWFSPETMAYFDSRIESGVLKGCYFITSEKGPDMKRAYTVRIAKDDGSIGSVSGFQEFAGLKAAENFINHLN